MDDVWGRFLGLSHGTTPAAVTTNKYIKMSSFKSSENIQKKEDGPDRPVSANQSFSVTLNELAMKARKYCNFEFQHGSHTLTDISLNRVQITKTILFLRTFLLISKDQK